MNNIFNIVVVLFTVCKMNVHKRCEKNVANSCGINTRDMAQVLRELGISGDKLNTKRKKVSYSTCLFARFQFAFVVSLNKLYVFDHSYLSWFTACCRRQFACTKTAAAKRFVLQLCYTFFYFRATYPVWSLFRGPICPHELTCCSHV